LNFDGVFSVLPTPFAQDGSLDLESLRRVVDLVIDAGVDGMTALGVTGEVDRLNESERHQVLETVLGHANGRVPVVAGATAQGLQTCIELSRAARDAGASAVMVSPPRLVKLNSDAVFAHFARLAEAVDILIVVQDYPPVSGYTMEPWLLARIAREIPRARAIKLEDPPTPFKTSRILEQAGATPVKILGGLGGVYLIEELLAGASGAMTGFAYPEMLVEVVRLFRSGHDAQAANAFYRYVPLMRFEFQPVIGMAIRKEILRRRGALAAAVVRAPAARLDAATTTALDGLLAWMRDGQGVKWISV
jgi:4-hydroxy-tetrahydrodipicolinate synthase